MTILYKRHVLSIFANALADRVEEVQISRAAITRAWPGAAAVQSMLAEPGMGGWELHDRIGPVERACECVFRRKVQPLPKPRSDPRTLVEQTPAKRYRTRKLAAE